MTNSLNTPVEALEHTYPFHVREYSIRRGTGGSGRYRGGDGIRRDIELLSPGQITILSDRRIERPYGLQGGEPGATGENVLIEADGSERQLAGKDSLWVRAGTTISVRTPGGGGWGTA